MAESACPKCGSADVIPDVTVVDHGHMNAPMELTAAVYRKPKATLFKQAATQRIRARVCGGCGFTELWVANPQALLTAAKAAKRNV